MPALPIDTIIQGDCLTHLCELPAESVQCCVTSPPYFGLRSYLPDGHQDKTKEVGAEETPEQYVARLVSVFREVRRVLRADGVLWLNLGDSYATPTKGDTRSPERLASVSTLGPKRNGLGGNNAVHRARSFQPREIHPGLPPKNLLGMPWRVAFALQADGWILRSDCIWEKPNAMPSSVTDRPTCSHEYVFLFAKNQRYFYDYQAIKEPAVPGSVSGCKQRLIGEALRQRSRVVTSVGTNIPWQEQGQGRNKRTVWRVATSPYKGAHFAVMPPALVETCLLAASRPGDVVLDPFAGSGTVPMVAKQHGRSYLGIELNASYITLAEQRIASASMSQPVKVIPLATRRRTPALPANVEQLALFA